MSFPGLQPTIEPVPQEPSLPPITARSRWIDLGLVMFISFADTILAALYALFHPSSVATYTTHPAWSIARMLVGDGAGFSMLAYVLSRQRRNLRSIGIGFRWSDPFKAIGLLFVATAIIGGLRQLVQGFDHLAGIAPDTRHVADAGWNERSISELIHVIWSPIFEEVLVRGYLMTEILELRQSATMAVCASVALQASYHVYYGFGAAVSLSGAFLVFAAYFLSSRRLMPVLLAHLSWDLIVYFRS